MIYDQGEGQWTEPTAEEREKAMGFPEGGTAVAGATEEERRTALGSAIDANTLTWLLSQLVAHQADQEVNQGEEMLAWAMVSLQGPASRTAEEGRTRGEDFQWNIGESLPAEQREVWIRMLEDWRPAFAFTLSQLGKYAGGEVSFKLNLTTSEPVRQRKRRWRPDHKLVAEEKCAELLAAGLIRRSESLYAAATVMAKKEDLLGNAGALRMCGDYRDLNKVTVRDSYPMPTPEEIFDRLHDSCWFSTLDLRQGFNQIRLQEEDCAKTAFHGPDGLYEWTVMPFGLRNASACFQRVMAAVLRGFPQADCFIDDVIVFSKEAEEHRGHVEEVLKRIQGAGLTCHLKKCQFAHGSIAYLGLQVGGGKLTVQKAKVAVLADMPAPKDIARLRTFLGFAGYYRRFVKDFASISKPLTLLLKGEEPWRWDESQQLAFERLKEELQVAPVLALPHPEWPYVLYTAWSAVGMGAVLS